MLDDILTDFVQSISFEASRCATYAGRQKLKYEDVEFAMRKNPLYLGKVQENFEKKAEVEKARKLQGLNESEQMKELAKEAGDDAAAGGGEKEAKDGGGKEGKESGKQKKENRGRKRKKEMVGEEDLEDE